MRHSNAALVVLAALLAAAPVAAAGAQELIVNGGFESGFSGWTRTEFPASNGTTFIGVGTSSPISGSPVPGARSGSAYAVTDALGPGAHALSQAFVLVGPVASATLRFSLSAANRASANFIGPDLNPFTTAPRQYASVDLFAGAVSGLATAGALQNLFLGGTVGSGAVPYTDYVLDVTSLFAAPGTYTLRFAEVDNVATFNLAVDDVSLVVVSAVPEPTTMLLLATGLGALAIGARRARRKSVPSK